MTIIFKMIFFQNANFDKYIDSYSFDQQLNKLALIKNFQTLIENNKRKSKNQSIKNLQILLKNDEKKLKDC